MDDSVRLYEVNKPVEDNSKVRHYGSLIHTDTQNNLIWQVDSKIVPITDIDRNPYSLRLFGAPQKHFPELYLIGDEVVIDVGLDTSTGGNYKIRRAMNLSIDRYLAQCAAFAASHELRQRERADIELELNYQLTPYLILRSQVRDIVDAKEAEVKRVIESRFKTLAPLSTLDDMLIKCARKSN